MAEKKGAAYYQSGQSLPEWAGGKAATTGANKKKPANQLGIVQRVKSIFGGGGPDPTNVSSHPEVKFKYKNPKPATATDTRSTIRKIGDELLGKTVGGNEIREIESVTSASTVGPRKKAPRTAVKKEVVATTPRRAVAKTATASASKPAARGFINERAASAGYTTSGTPRDPGFTYGSKSSAAPKVRAAKKQYMSNLNAKHDSKGLKWFRGSRD